MAETQSMQIDVVSGFLVNKIIKSPQEIGPSQNVSLPFGLLCPLIQQIGLANSFFPP